MSSNGARVRMYGMLGGGIFLLLFGLLLVTEAWGIWQRYWVPASWDQAPATVLSAELVEHHSADSEGSTSSTWEVACSYRYEAGGTPIPGTRTIPTAGSDSLREIHERRHRILQEHLRDGTPVRVWVNPEDPTESFVFREFDPFFWYFVAFGGPMTFFGLWLIVYPAVHGIRAGAAWWRRRRARGW